MSRKNKKDKKDEKTCDPMMCDNCNYIGEGDFICDRGIEPVLVMYDWAPTENFERCKK